MDTCGNEYSSTVARIDPDFGFKTHLLKSKTKTLKSASQDQDSNLTTGLNVECNVKPRLLFLILYYLLKISTYIHKVWQLTSQNILWLALLWDIITSEGQFLVSVKGLEVSSAIDGY